jgi:drug/metabolite transporter (DMT)-like permease
MRNKDGLRLLWLGTTGCLTAGIVLTALDKGPFARVLLFGGTFAGLIVIWVNRRKGPAGASRGSTFRDGAVQNDQSGGRRRSRMRGRERSDWWMLAAAGAVSLSVGVLLAVTGATRIGVWLGFMFATLVFFISAVVAAHMDRRR